MEFFFFVVWLVYDMKKVVILVVDFDNIVVGVWDYEMFFCVMVDCKFGVNKFVVVCIIEFEEEFVFRVEYLYFVIVLVGDDYMVFVVYGYFVRVIELIVIIFFWFKFFDEFFSFDIKVLDMVVIVVCD